MRKFLVFFDSEFGKASRHEISPLNYLEFIALDMWAGASDTAFATWLRYNRLVEVRDYNSDALEHSTIELDFNNARTYKFNPSGDGETWTIATMVVRGRQPLRKPSW